MAPVCKGLAFDGVPKSNRIYTASLNWHAERLVIIFTANRKAFDSIALNYKKNPQ